MSREPLHLSNPAPRIAIPLACSGIGVVYKNLLSASPAGAATLFLFDLGAFTDSWFPHCRASCTRLNSSLLPLLGKGSLNLSADSVLVLVGSFAEVIPEPSAPWPLMIFLLLASVKTFALSTFFFKFPGAKRDLETFPAFLLTASTNVVFINFLLFACGKDFVQGSAIGSFKLCHALELSADDRKKSN